MNHRILPIDDFTLAQELKAAMGDFTQTRPARSLDGRGMLAKARRRTWTIAGAAAAAVLLISGGAFAATLAVRGSDRPNGIATQPAPGPSSPVPTSAPATSPGAGPLSAAESRRASEVVTKVYSIFENHLTMQTGSASSYFTGHHAYTTAWGSGSAPSAPMACGATFDGAVLGDATTAGTAVLIPVELLKAATPAKKHAVVRLNRASMKVAAIDCQTGRADLGSAEVGTARDAVVALYGPYLGGKSSTADDAVTPQFAAGPDGHDEMEQFNHLVCSQDDPGDWVAGSVSVAGSSANVLVTLGTRIVPVTVDTAQQKVSFVDCEPLPPVPASATVSATRTFLTQFVAAYEVAWGWRGIRPPRPLLAGYFADGVLDQAWTDEKGLLPAGCGSPRPYVDLTLASSAPTTSGSAVTFKVILLDADDTEVGTGKLTYDRSTRKITKLSC